MVKVTTQALNQIFQPNLKSKRTEGHSFANNSHNEAIHIATWRDLLNLGNATDFFSRRTFLPFDPSTSEFTPTHALWLAELCRLAYRHDTEADSCPTRANILENSGFKHPQLFSSTATNAQAMLIELNSNESRYAALIFRGTEQNIKDVFMDLSIGILRHQNNKIDVKEAFKKALDSIWGEIASAVQQLNYPLFFAGHGLGAALATLAAARHPPTALYTFGSPRVGDATFAASLSRIENTFHRVVYDEDIVTDLPPMELGFQHVGKALHLPATLSLSWMNNSLHPPRFLADHAAINYVDRV